MKADTTLTKEMLVEKGACADGIKRFAITAIWYSMSSIRLLNRYSSTATINNATISINTIQPPL
jgi:hypothetical protein